MFNGTCTTSRVVPAMDVTISTGRRASTFNKLLLPTFGGPRIALQNLFSSAVSQMTLDRIRKHTNAIPTIELEVQGGCSGGVEYFSFDLPSE